MLTLLAIALGLVVEQQAASGTVISADEIATTLKLSIANNVVDQPVKAADLPGGHKASLALLRRTKPETSALIHNRVTEIYQITEGSGRIGPTLSLALPAVTMKPINSPERMGPWSCMGLQRDP